MANSLQLNTSTVFAGLGTSTFTVVTAGLYTVRFKSTLPYIAAGTSNNSTVTAGGSALQVVVNQNGSPVLTVGGSATNPTPTQPSLGSSVVINCAAADVITVVLSSANAVDALPNSVKTIINLFQGE
jgi:hypothetical protein